MRIEALRAPTVRGGRYLATLDTGRKLRLEPPVVEAFGLFAGRELEEAEFLRLQAENRKASAKARAVRMVAASAVSRGELERRLVAKGEDWEDARAAVAWLTELDLLDDRKTARQLAEAAARKGYGPARIRQVLYQKGIDRSLWEEAMADLPAPDGAIDRFWRPGSGAARPTSGKSAGPPRRWSDGDTAGATSARPCPATPTPWTGSLTT